MERDAELRRRVAAWCLILTPVLLTIADLLAIPDVRSHYARHTYSGLVLHLVSIVCLLPAVLGLAHLLRRPAPAYALAASGAAALGFMGGANIMAVRLYEWALQNGLEADLFARVRDLPAEVEGAVAPVILGPGLFTPLAMLLVGIGLWRWTRLPRWALALLLVGAVLFPAGRVSVTQELILASDVLLLPSMIFLGTRLLRGPEAWSLPVPRVAAAG